MSDEPSIRHTREHATELPKSARLFHIDPNTAFRDTDTLSQRDVSEGLGEQTVAQPIVADRAVMQPVVEDFLADQWRGREAAVFALPPSQLQVTVGDQVRFAKGESAKRWTVTEIEDGDVRRITTVARIAGETPSSVYASQQTPDLLRDIIALPQVVFMDLPLLPGRAGEANRIAIAAKPWPGPMVVYVSETPDDHRFHQFVDEVCDCRKADAAT